MSAHNEAVLAAQLVRELRQLALLEGYRQSHLSEVRVTLTDNSASNEQASHGAVTDGLEALVNANLSEMIQTVIANQRLEVAAARTALLDLQFALTQAEAKVVATSSDRLFGTTTGKEVDTLSPDADGPAPHAAALPDEVMTAVNCGEGPNAISTDPVQQSADKALEQVD